MIKKSKTRQGRGYSGLAKMLTIMALLLCVSTGAWAQNSTTYNVTFGGFGNSYMNITVETTLPITFEEIDDYLICPWQVWDGFAGCGDYEFTGASVTSGGNGKVSVNFVDWSKITITVTGTFEGTATIHVTGTDNNSESISRDITVSCPAPPQLYTVSMKDGTEDADKWTIAPAEATTTGVDEGTEITATYSGNRRVKGVKAVKKGGAAPSGPVAINVTSPAVGQVIGSDGKNYAVGSLPSGVTAIALIAFVNQNNGYVIAVAMTDEEGTMGWDAAKEACTAHTPTVTGASWAMPSQEGGWYLLFNAFGGSSNSCTGLNTAIENAGGKALQNGNYWAKLNDAYPYPIGINNGTVTYSKDESTNHEYRARAVLLINAGNGEVIGT